MDDHQKKSRSKRWMDRQSSILSEMPKLPRAQLQSEDSQSYEEVTTKYETSIHYYIQPGYYPQYIHPVK